MNNIPKQVSSIDLKTYVSRSERYLRVVELLVQNENLIIKQVSEKLPIPNLDWELRYCLNSVIHSIAAQNENFGLERITKLLSFDLSADFLAQVVDSLQAVCITLLANEDSSEIQHFFEYISGNLRLKAEHLNTPVANASANLTLVAALIQLIATLPEQEQLLIKKHLLENNSSETTKQHGKFINFNRAFDFLDDEPDLYSLDDGEPV